MEFSVYQLLWLYVYGITFLTVLYIVGVHCFVLVRDAAGKTPIRTPVYANMRSTVFSYLRYQSHTAHQQGPMVQPKHETIKASIIVHFIIGFYLV